jgi:hypothetical protein
MHDPVVKDYLLLFYGDLGEWQQLNGREKEVVQNVVRQIHIFECDVHDLRKITFMQTVYRK